MQKKLKIFEALKTPFSKNKKGQLVALEMKYFFVGFFIGIILILVLVLLGTKGILPFKIPVC